MPTGFLAMRWIIGKLSCENNTIQTNVVSVMHLITYGIIDGRPFNFLLRVLLLLELENMLVEIEVQILVCVIDAQLLKAVLGKIFKSKYVEDTNGRGLLSSLVNDVINSSDQPGKQGTVQRFGERVASVEGLVNI